MEINIPDIVAEVTDAFLRSEKALGTNDVDTGLARGFGARLGRTSPATSEARDFRRSP
jgi:hypothetical protein